MEATLGPPLLLSARATALVQLPCKVEGLVMKSLPARHRRRRKAPETARDEEKAWVHCECLSACAWCAVQASKAAVLELAVEELSNVQDPHPSVADAGVALEFEEERRQFEYLDAWMFGIFRNGVKAPPRVTNFLTGLLCRGWRRRHSCRALLHTRITRRM